jgi:hypothetical protein
LLLDLRRFCATHEIKETHTTPRLTRRGKLRSFQSKYRRKAPVQM